MVKKDEHLWLQTPAAVDAPMRLERWTDEDQAEHDEGQSYVNISQTDLGKLKCTWPPFYMQPIHGLQYTNKVNIDSMDTSTSYDWQCIERKYKVLDGYDSQYRNSIKAMSLKKFKEKAEQYMTLLDDVS